jgi:hypothetical protein
MPIRDREARLRAGVAVRLLSNRTCPGSGASVLSSILAPGRRFELRTLRLTDRCAPFKNRDPCSPSVAECRQMPGFATGVAVCARWAAHEAVTVVLVVMNWAVPIFTINGSGCGPAGVGIMAGDCTLKIA